MRIPWMGVMEIVIALLFALNIGMAVATGLAISYAAAAFIGILFIANALTRVRTELISIQTEQIKTRTEIMRTRFPELRGPWDYEFRREE